MDGVLADKLIDFKKGEIDFIVELGKRVIPIEVKLTPRVSEINTQLIEEYLATQNTPFGIILYGGAPFIDEQKKLVYYPYWLL